jgi:hypothetical protein
MAWYDKLVGNTPGDPNNLSGEELLGMVPSVIGAYESGRGKAIGGPLQVLGNVMEKQGQRRQAFGQAQDSDMAQLGNLTARFGKQDPNLLNANDPQLEALGNLVKTDPQAAQAQITQMYNEQLGREQEQIAQQEKMRQESLPKLRTAPNGQLVQQTTDPTTGQISIQPIEGYDKLSNGATYKTPFSTLVAGELGDKTAAKIYGDYNRDMVDRNIAQYKEHLNLNLEQINRLPIEKAAPGFVPVQVTDPKSPYYLGRDPRVKTYGDTERVGAGLIARADVPKLIGLRSVRQQLSRFDDLVGKALPTEGDTPLSTWLTTTKNGLFWNQKIRAGNVTGTRFDLMNVQTALEMQKLLTGSTRPLNQVEFDRIAGGIRENGVADLPGIRDMGAVLPTKYDTAEQGHAKLKEIGANLDDQVNAMTGGPSISSILPTMGSDSRGPTLPPPEPSTTPDAGAIPPLGDDTTD